MSWSATDELSGIASGGADPSLGATPTGFKMTLFASGSHTFSSHATDGVGNNATSTPRSVLLSAVHETAATFAGAWSTSTTTTGSWGRTRYATRRGATATVSFTGTDVAWVAPRGPKKGRARVFIDGVLRATIDLHASSAQARRVVFSATGLAAGPHTLKIVVRGTSGRPRVDIDGFVTLAPAP